MRPTPFFLPFFILLFYAGISSEAAAQSNSERADKDGKSLLWKVEREDREAPIYLFGTMHMIPKSDFKIGEGLRSAILNSDVLVMELSLEEANMLAALGKMLLEEGKTLEDLMSPQQFDSLSSFLLDTLHLPEMQYQMVLRMKPFLASQFFYKDMMGADPASFELTFKALADSAGLQIMGLESIEEQIAVIDSIPLDEQIRILMQGLRSSGTMEGELDEMISIYLSQDLDSLYNYMNRSSEDLMEFDDLLLERRNENWIKKIEKLEKAGY